MSGAAPLTASPKPIRVGPLSNGMLMTPDEYDAIEEWDDLYRYELVHGVLVVSPLASAGERGPNEEAAFIVYDYQEHDSSGSVVDDTLPEQEIKTPKSRRRADRAIWIGLGRDPVLRTDVPTIAIEFVSDSGRDRRRDYEAKREEYAAAGVQEYWVIDRFRRTTTVFGGTESSQIVKEDEVYCTPLMPGFELPLDRIFKRADRYNK